ncbi:MAG: nitrate ABC transporter substrate-binding protein, partial [Massilia sp.]
MNSDFSLPPAQPRRRQLMKAGLALPLVASAPAHAATNHLVVGGLPVTCNLTLPVACTARAVSATRPGATPYTFEYSKYSGWPEIKESLMTG